MLCDIIGFPEKCRMPLDAFDDGGFAREEQFRPVVSCMALIFPPNNSSVSSIRN